MGFVNSCSDYNIHFSKLRNAFARVVLRASGEALEVYYSNKLRINFIVMLFVVIGGLASCKGTDKEEKTVPTDEIKTSPRKEPELVYDAKGNITERHSINYSTDNTIRSIENYYYKYDDRNNLVEEIKESRNPQGEPVFKNVNRFTYNDLNQKTEQVFFSYDHNSQLRQQARNTFRYSGKGDMIEEKSYYPDGTVKSVIHIERTANGLLKAEEYIYFDEKGQKTDHKKYSYSRYGLEKTEDLMKK